MENGKQRLITERIINSPCYDEHLMDLMLSEIGARIQKERVNQGLSVNELVEMTGMNITHLYRIEKGQKPVGLKILIKIAIALNVPIDSFFPFEHKEEKIEDTYTKKFEEMTRDFDDNTMNFVFGFIDHLKNHLESTKK